MDGRSRSRRWVVWRIHRRCTTVAATAFAFTVATVPPTSTISSTAATDATAATATGATVAAKVLGIKAVWRCCVVCDARGIAATPHCQRNRGGSAQRGTRSNCCRSTTAAVARTVLQLAAKGGEEAGCFPLACSRIQPVVGDLQFGELSPELCVFFA